MSNNQKLLAYALSIIALSGSALVYMIINFSDKVEIVRVSFWVFVITGLIIALGLARGDIKMGEWP